MIGCHGSKLDSQWVSVRSTCTQSHRITWERDGMHQNAPVCVGLICVITLHNLTQATACGYSSTLLVLNWMDRLKVFTMVIVLWDSNSPCRWVVVHFLPAHRARVWITAEQFSLLLYQYEDRFSKNSEIKLSKVLKKKSAHLNEVGYL
jgi:hypothetical protein